MLHDSLGSVDLWRDFPPSLAALIGRRVIAYDRLGFGKSDPNPEMLGPGFIDDEANTGLAYVRNALGIDRMILFGHSVGGGMAIAGGAKFASQTDAVIALSAQAFDEDRTIEGINEAKLVLQDQGQLARLARYHGDKANWVLDAWIETWLAPSFAKWSLDEALRRIQCPILAIHGDHDEYGSRAQPDRIAALASGPVTVHLVENCHHLPHKERPDEILHLIHKFVLGL